MFQICLSRSLHLRLPLAAVSLLLLSSLAFGQASKTTNGVAAGLSKAQVKKLRAVKKHRFIVPSRVPAGFKLTEFKLENREGIQDFSVTYTKGKADVLIQMTSEGIGDVILDADDAGDAPYTGFDFKNPVFGRHHIDTLRTKTANQSGMNWVDLGEKALPRFVSMIGTGLSDKELRVFAEGLRFLK